MKKSERIEHKSFGMISFTRVSSLGRFLLFGSSIRHRNCIRLDIHNAHLKRDLYQDWIHEGKLLLSVEMSFTQFAEAITSMNRQGIPCTVTFANEKRIEGIEIKNKRVQIDEEFEKFAEEIASGNNEFYQKIGDILNKKHIGKRDRVEIKKQLDLLKMQIASNIPFIKTQFSEQMDKTVLEAKNEFDAFVENKIKRVGLIGFKKELLALTEKMIQEGEVK